MSTLATTAFTFEGSKNGSKYSKSIIAVQNMGRRNHNKT
jgi:hypothetical protein